MNSPSNDNIAKGAGKAQACPICSDKSVEAYTPFCSKRCADVDLHRWLTGSYAIPAVESAGDDDVEE